MNRIRWNSMLQALVLVRIGQELGTDTPAARAIHDAIVMLATVVSTLSRGQQSNAYATLPHASNVDGTTQKGI